MKSTDAVAMRLVTYNVEWFSSLFGADDRLLMDGGTSGRHGVDRDRQARALAQVFKHLDADGIMVIEAPDTNNRRKTLRALEHFAKEAGLRSTEAVIGFANDTQQEIAFLYDPKVLRVAHTPGDSDEAPRFDGVFHIDLDVDAQKDAVRFSKPPLELTVTTNGGREISLIGAHLKSKAPHGARSEDHAVTLSIANRRKQLAQAIWLRRRVEQLLAEGRDVMVMGDLVLLEDEVARVTIMLVKEGIEVTALHNHLLNENPGITYLHFSGKGKAKELAEAIHSALSLTGTPTQTQQTAASKTPNIDWSKIETIFAKPGQKKGNLFQISFPRKETIQEHGIVISPFLGMASIINMQMIGEQAATAGEFVLLADEVQPVVKALISHNLSVTAIHSHMLHESPRLFFLRFWGYDKPETLATLLKAALDKTNSKK